MLWLWQNESAVVRIHVHDHAKWIVQNFDDSGVSSTFGQRRAGGQPQTPEIIVPIKIVFHLRVTSEIEILISGMAASLPIPVYTNLEEVYQNLGTSLKHA